MNLLRFTSTLFTVFCSSITWSMENAPGEVAIELSAPEIERVTQENLDQIYKKLTYREKALLPLVHRADAERLKRARKYATYSIAVLTGSVFASVGLTTYLTMNVPDNLSAILIGLTWPSLAASPFAAASFWNLMEARRAKMPMDQTSEEELKDILLELIMNENPDPELKDE